VGRAQRGALTGTESEPTIHGVMVQIARLDRDAPLGRVMRNRSGGCGASAAGTRPAREERRRRPTFDRDGVRPETVASLPERRTAVGPYTRSFASGVPSAGNSPSPGPRQTRTPGRERPPRTPAKRVRSEKEGVAHAPPPLTDTCGGGAERRRMDGRSVKPLAPLAFASPTYAAGNLL